jgi:hypothetical protein
MTAAVAVGSRFATAAQARLRETSVPTSTVYEVVDVSADDVSCVVDPDREEHPRLTVLARAYFDELVEAGAWVRIAPALVPLSKHPVLELDTHGNVRAFRTRLEIRMRLPIGGAR